MTKTADSKKTSPATGKKLAVLAKSKSARKKQRKTGRRDDLTSYIYKVLKQVHPDTGFSKKGMAVMNSFAKDIFEQLAAQAADLAKIDNRKTLHAKDFSAACRLILPGELAKHAVSEGSKAVTKFDSK